MSTYKVIQDIEAEDKLVGPLTLRQFVYAGITMLCIYLCFIGLTKNIIVIIPIFLPIALVTGFFAFPWGREQPTEIWALAKIRFMIKPRLRIWNQSGVKELVTITAPKKVERNYTDGLSQNEVKSRLKALADTIDSRGWAIKNVNVNLYAQPLDGGAPTSDRLVGASVLPQQVSSLDIRASDDILDEHNNPVAQQFETMIEKSAQDHRQQVIQTMSQVMNQLPTLPQTQHLAPPPLPGLQTRATNFNPTMNVPVPQQAQATLRPPDNYWFTQQPPATPGAVTQTMTPGTARDPWEPTAEERAAAKPASAMTAKSDPAIIAFASNNDLNVATIARQANIQQRPDEVIISLH